MTQVMDPPPGFKLDAPEPPAGFKLDIAPTPTSAAPAQWDISNRGLPPALPGGQFGAKPFTGQLPPAENAAYLKTATEPQGVLGTLAGKLAAPITEGEGILQKVVGSTIFPYSEEEQRNQAAARVQNEVNAKANPIAAKIGGYGSMATDPDNMVAGKLVGMAAKPLIGATPGMLGAVRSGSLKTVGKAIAGSSIENAVANAGLTAAKGGTPQQVAAGAAQGAILGPVLHSTIGVLGEAGGAALDAVAGRLAREHPQLTGAEVHKLAAEVAASPPPPGFKMDQPIAQETPNALQIESSGTETVRDQSQGGQGVRQPNDTGPVQEIAGEGQAQGQETKGPLNASAPTVAAVPEPAPAAAETVKVTPQKAAGQFSDPADAEYMLRRFLKPVETKPLALPENSSIGQTGLSEGPPGPIQIAPLLKKAGINTASAIGAVRNLRERFSPLEGRYGADISKSFTKAVTGANSQADTIAGSLLRRAFEGTSDPAQYARDWTDLGRYYRLKEMQTRMPGQQVGAGLPTLSPAEVTRLENDPVIQRATKMYNDEVAPLLTAIRQKNGMLMNPNASKMPFFLNLPGEFDGPGSTDTSVNPNFAFNKSATGNSQLLMDPRESLAAAIRGHLSTDYKQDLVNLIKGQYSVPQASVVPSGKNTYSANFRGKTVEVSPVDLAQNNAPYPLIKYVPKDIAYEYNHIKQDRGKYDTLFDKAVQLGTKVAVVGDLAPHAARVIAHVGARNAQSGESALGMLPSWLGSNERAIGRMKEMVKSPLGEGLQLLIDRSGSDKGHGFDVKPGQTQLGKWLAKPHDLLFNPDYGVDPMGRRVIADAHLRTLFGNDFVEGMETDLKSGKINSAQFADALEKKMSDSQFLGLARKVNGTMGFANKQTRSNLLNWVSRVAPFVGSESGMIPREIGKVANLDIPGLANSIKSQRWGQAASQLGGSLATGALGVYLLGNAINYANTKAQTGQGRFMSDNDADHKLDIWLAPGWHLSNLDPTFSRGTRLVGLKGKANGEDWAQSVGMEAINEPLSVMAKTGQIYITAASAMAGAPSAPHLVKDEKTGKIQLTPTNPSEMGGLPLVRNTVRAASTGQSLAPAAIQDAASSLLGAQLNYSPDEGVMNNLYSRLDTLTQKKMSGKATAAEIGEHTKLNRLAVMLSKMRKARDNIKAEGGNVADIEARMRDVAKNAMQ